MKKKFLTHWFFAKRNVTFATQMLAKPNNAWTALAEIDECTATRFVYFFATCCAVAKFFGFWIFDDGTFPVALLAAAFRALALLTAWWLSLRYLPTLAVRLFKVEIPPRETALLAAFGLLPVFVVYLILAFTSASFLYFLALYNYIILYGGVGVLLDTDERTRGRLAQMVAVWLWALPLAIEWLLRLLVPNAPL